MDKHSRAYVYTHIYTRIFSRIYALSPHQPTYIIWYRRYICVCMCNLYMPVLTIWDAIFDISTLTDYIYRV
ncbi:hypothetical protein OrNV_gp128 [Oryctes rhinoceros nudivirus]|uniref:Uncharacterized protein n=1 Tax=Oryctes rhinoceros nudivirus TaxID=92521 RepID=B7SVE9_9VIRU|nr:hypothetical protein OrNV_gp128 [Oryctes rhinoceros nudivirus]ACH96258.1 unknown [Oryctes rhinoceros nudivirus]